MTDTREYQTKCPFFKTKEQFDKENERAKKKADAALQS